MYKQGQSVLAIGEMSLLKKEGSVSGEQRNQIRILLADGHKMVRQGIRRIFEAEKDMEVVGEADDAEQTIKLDRELNPDIIVMEARMSKLDGVETVKRVKVQHPEVAILVLTAHEHEEYIGDMIRAGAGGCLLKSSDANRLIKSMMFLREGVFVCDSGVEQKILEQAARPRPLSVDYGQHLTPRETEILKLVGEGFSNRSVGDYLGISERTVKGHFGNIMGKLGVRSRTEAVLEAIKRGLVSPRGK
ncbi:response regulator [Chloroflexota bacterium]